MADDCIRRSDVLNEIHRFRGYIDEDLEYRMKFEFNRIPSADVRPVVRGKWEDRKGLYEVGYKCSLCGFFSLTRTNFCPNCGSYNGGEHET